MKRALAFLLAGSMAFGISACGTKETDTPQTAQETDVAEKDTEEAAFVWENDAKEEPSAMLKGLTEDIVVSVLKESYPNYRRWEGYTLTVKNLTEAEGVIEMDFDLDAAYRELTEDENPAMPLIVGEEEKHFTLPLRLTATETEGKIDTDDIYVEVRGENAKENCHLLTQELPDFDEVGTFIGTIEFPYPDTLTLHRKFRIEETHGYTDNGYFLMETHNHYTIPLDENCAVSYFADASTVENMTVEELQQMENLEEHLFMVTNQNGKISDIIELYRP